MLLSEYLNNNFDGIAEIMPLVMKMRYNPETLKYLQAIAKSTVSKDKAEKAKYADVKLYDLFCVYVKNEPEATKKLFSMLNGREISDYDNAALLLRDIMKAYTEDDNLIELFGLRVQTKTEASSGLATENTEA